MGPAITDFLTPSSSFAIGAGSAFNLAGSYFDYNQSITPAEADARALSSDWSMIGRDIMVAVACEKLERITKAE